MSALAEDNLPSGQLGYAGHEDDTRLCVSEDIKPQFTGEIHGKAIQYCVQWLNRAAAAALLPAASLGHSGARSHRASVRQASEGTSLAGQVPPLGFNLVGSARGVRQLESHSYRLGFGFAQLFSWIL